VNIQVLGGNPISSELRAEWEGLLRRSPAPNPFLMPVRHEMWLYRTRAVKK
jgi:hypothetical protein